MMKFYIKMSVEVNSDLFITSNADFVFGKLIFLPMFFYTTCFLAIDILH